MKGIILAGGTGSRLFPLTKVTSKHLLPVYNRPMIYYPLATLMEMGIKEILIISGKEHIQWYKKLLGTGVEYGASFNYATQDKSIGIPEAFIIANNFIGKEEVTLVLGDNIFIGEGLINQFKSASKEISESKEGAYVFAYQVKDPSRFAVVTFSENGEPYSIIEKPTKTMSNYSVIGIYIYDNKVVQYTQRLEMSSRNELEITDLNNIYCKLKKLKVKIINEKNIWLDAGTYESLYEASSIIRDREIKKKKTVSSFKEIAIKNGWI